MKIGRNHPCPCGSGKKYKNCCTGNVVPISGLNKKFIDLLAYDFGPPDLSESFFKKNPHKELSAASLIYSSFLMPGIEEFSNQQARRFINNRGRDEAEQIKEASPEMLIELMYKEVDSINVILLKQSLLANAETVIPKIINKLKNNRSDFFAEVAIKALHKSKINYSKQILDIFDEIQDPYTLSIVNLLLGFIGPKESIQLVWKHYHAFKGAYPSDTLDQGPLFGLHRFKERFDKNSLLVTTR